MENVTSIDKLKSGMELTFRNDYVTEYGHLTAAKGAKATIKDITITPGHWGVRSQCWIETKIHTIQLNEYRGCWLPRAFEETINSLTQ